MMIDATVLPPMQQKYIHQRQKEILEKRMNQLDIGCFYFVLLEEHFKLVLLQCNQIGQNTWGNLFFFLFGCNVIPVTNDSSCYLLLFDVLQHLHLLLQVVDRDLMLLSFKLSNRRLHIYQLISQMLFSFRVTSILFILKMYDHLKNMIDVKHDYLKNMTL